MKRITLVSITMVISLFYITGKLNDTIVLDKPFDGCSEYYKTFGMAKNGRIIMNENGKKIAYSGYILEGDVKKDDDNHFQSGIESFSMKEGHEDEMYEGFDFTDKVLVQDSGMVIKDKKDIIGTALICKEQE